MKFKKTLLVLTLICLPGLSQAGWRDYLNDFKKSVKEEVPSSVLTEDKIAEGLKQALDQGIRQSVNQLGTKNGFLGDASVKIPMPQSLKKLDKGLRKVGQEKVADKFVNTMNHAAEKAVPGTSEILVQAVKSMTLEDAAKILNGKPDAATQYFKRTSQSRLRSVIKPLVSDATDSVGLTDTYKRMMKKAGFMAKYVDKDSLDIDQYITNKTIDGLFIKIAIEEKRIRKDPVARTTELLKEVFGG